MRSLGLSVYLPTFLFALGRGAVTPVVALAAIRLGASPAVAAVVVGLRALGVVVTDVPAGWMIERLGERRALALASVATVGPALVAAGTGSLAVFAACSFLLGCGWSVWFLARLTYVSEVMPIELRGRALSTLGGVNGVGSLSGPFIGAGVTTFAGIAGAYYVQAIVAALASAALFAALRGARGAVGRSAPGAASFPAIVRERRRVFLTAGTGAMGIQMLRAGREGLVPLWAAHLSMSASVTSTVFGISSAVETSLFYPAGLAMDRIGRKAVAVTCLCVMALGLATLPLVGGFAALTAAAMVLGVGSGVGAGITMTIGADFAPDAGRAQFLGAWRLVADSGSAVAPMAIASVTAAASLAGAAVVTAGIGLAAAGVVALFMAESLPARRLDLLTTSGERPPDRR